MHVALHQPCPPVHLISYLAQSRSIPLEALVLGLALVVVVVPVVDSYHGPDRGLGFEVASVKYSENLGLMKSWLEISRNYRCCCKGRGMNYWAVAAAVVADTAVVVVAVYLAYRKKTSEKMF